MITNYAWWHFYHFAEHTTYDLNRSRELHQEMKRGGARERIDGVFMLMIAYRLQMHTEQ